MSNIIKIEVTPKINKGITVHSVIKYNGEEYLVITGGRSPKKWVFMNENSVLFFVNSFTCNNKLKQNKFTKTCKLVIKSFYKLKTKE